MIIVEWKCLQDDDNELLLHREVYHICKCHLLITVQRHAMLFPEQHHDHKCPLPQVTPVNPKYLDTLVLRRVHNHIKETRDHMLD